MTTGRPQDRIAIYLRLSKEDEQNRDESNSITSQRELIMDYISRDRELSRLEVVECCDDGYTGKNMNRPGMEKLLGLIRSRLAGTVIVKDMSRFSRDYLVLGQYTEQIFPFMGIRFIAVNDHYDSDRCDGGIGEIDVAFKAMLYDFYSEDLSRKVKTAIRARKDKGSFTNTFAPYGYRKDPSDRHLLVPEPFGAEIVRRIFRDYADGKSMYQIAKELNKEHVDPPIIYARKRDGKEYGCRWKNTLPSWTTSNISRLLHDETYIGTLVYNKTHNPEPGAPHSILNPEPEWIRKEEACPAIIEEELFRRASVRYGGNGIYRWGTKSSSSKKHYLSGKVVCAGCRHKMLHDAAKDKIGKPNYYCSHRYYAANNEKCVSSIRDEDLESVLAKLITEKIRVLPDSGLAVEKEQEQIENRLTDATGRLRRMRQTQENIRCDLFKAYESYKEGLTGKDTYLQQRRTYEKMLERLAQDIERQEEAVMAIREKRDRHKKNPHFDLQNHPYPDRAFAELFIRKITVHADKTLDVEWNDYGQDAGEKHREDKPF